MRWEKGEKDKDKRVKKRVIGNPPEDAYHGHLVYGKWCEATSGWQEVETLVQDHSLKPQLAEWKIEQLGFLVNKRFGHNDMECSSWGT